MEPSRLQSNSWAHGKRGEQKSSRGSPIRSVCSSLDVRFAFSLFWQDFLWDLIRSYKWFVTNIERLILADWVMLFNKVEPRHLLSANSNPRYLELFFCFPWEFELAGFYCITPFSLPLRNKWNFVVNLHKSTGRNCRYNYPIKTSVIWGR